MGFRACPECGWMIPVHFALPADAGLAQQTVCPNDECRRHLVRHRGDDGWSEWALGEAPQRDQTGDTALHSDPVIP